MVWYFHQGCGRSTRMLLVSVRCFIKVLLAWQVIITQVVVVGTDPLGDEYAESAIPFVARVFAPQQ